VDSGADWRSDASEIQTDQTGLGAAMTIRDTVGIICNRGPAAAANLREKAGLVVSTTLVLVNNT
jgi:hypothetical protein